ncbi:hypothetical protein M2164_007433 [Streptomyces sp. SAI-208]|uniref:hypothetical protein n=1 Tax=unclassified Streptomyces TaxID=2593676 RepID=UPI0024752168|nr:MULTISPECIES: hypothetical protein [unclassified Streptomyces]MDH6520811.1 hypothetical protein [Streptomyces sp. SAI-090]MDH6553030.1 hypothetical protein [Streptomyces sp. SAI-041]MDH6572114.1 hypothetical protein [Streptomyces sp. SAI-117]MDH6582926.1 hypothetical protein [Streptomyces sp. SAI-133]MDH6611798.1 hypothetical protein [Streptomyces sp. SAI-208]
MKPPRRAPLLALLALTSCGIPATGVVQAGGPASGTLPLTQVYFVENGSLVAVSRITEEPGEPEAALRLLMAGPLAGEGRLEGLATEVPGLPTSAALPTATAGAPGEPSSDAPTVTAEGDRMTIRLPPGLDTLSDIGVRQVVCTAAAAYRLTRPSVRAVTAEVTDGAGRRVRGSDAGCPGR